MLHILKAAPVTSTKKIIDIQKAGNQITVIELFKGGANNDALVAEVFSHDRVFCW